MIGIICSKPPGAPGSGIGLIKDEIAYISQTCYQDLSRESREHVTLVKRVNVRKTSQHYRGDKSPKETDLLNTPPFCSHAANVRTHLTP